jgi:hypothetical protein
MSLTGCNKSDRPSSEDGGTPTDCTTGTCPDACKLVSITVILNATQTDVTGDKNWATVKKATDDVIVEATTDPNTEACWKQINWSGDSGSPGDKANQRKLSRADSRKFHVEAELGGVKDHVDVWVLWADLVILTSGKTPTNAVQFGSRYDGTENLGARNFDRGNQARGKVVPVATITPAGVHDIVQAGWAIKREKLGHRAGDGVYSKHWTVWTDDTSAAGLQRLIPDNDDKIYDRDAPSIGKAGYVKTGEAYINFQQWVEWNGEKCSDNANWYWNAHWEKSSSPRVSLKDVGTGHIVLPAAPHFPP